MIESREKIKTKLLIGKAIGTNSKHGKAEIYDLIMIMRRKHHTRRLFRFMKVTRYHQRKVCNFFEVVGSKLMGEKKFSLCFFGVKCSISIFFK